MARFAVICYILFGLSNLRVTVSPRGGSSEGDGRKEDGRRRKSKRKRENKKGERVKGGLGCLDPGGSYYGRREKRGARVVHFASILRQIAAYLSDFCSRTKPCRPPPTRVKDGGTEKGG